MAVFHAKAQTLDNYKGIANIEWFAVPLLFLKFQSNELQDGDSSRLGYSLIWFAIRYFVITIPFIRYSNLFTISASIMRESIPP